MRPNPLSSGGNMKKHEHRITSFSLVFIVSFLVLLNDIVLPENGGDFKISSALITDKKVFKNTKYQLPKGFEAPSTHGAYFTGNAYRVRLFAKDFAQGEAVYIEIESDKNIDPSDFQAIGLYDNRSIPLSKTEWGYRGLFGISPEEKTGLKNITILAGPKGAVSEARASVYVAKTDFPRYESSMDLGSYSNASSLTKETVEFIKECQRKKRIAFGTYTNTLQVTNKLAHPRDMHKITSPFYATRVVTNYKMQGGKKIPLTPSTNIHRGLDLRGLIGEPIFAMADGRVVLSEKMYYEGNLTLIDHGNGVLSTYMHQDSLTVKEGDLVTAGQKIGTVGATGAVTGSHLHVSVYIRGVPVDPLGLLALPIRN